MSLPIKQLLLGGSDDMVVSLQPQEEQEGEPGNKITITISILLFCIIKNKNRYKSISGKQEPPRLGKIKSKVNAYQSQALAISWYINHVSINFFLILSYILKSRFSNSYSISQRTSPTDISRSTFYLPPYSTSCLFNQMFVNFD